MGIACVEPHLLVRESPEEQCAKRLTVLVPIASGSKPIMVVRCIGMPEPDNLFAHFRRHVEKIHGVPEFQNCSALGLEAADGVADCNLTAC